MEASSVTRVVPYLFPASRVLNSPSSSSSKILLLKMQKLVEFRMLMNQLGMIERHQLHPAVI